MRITWNYKGILEPRIDFKAILDNTYNIIGVKYKGINIIKVIIADYVNNLVNN
jgi:hypothetical protein